MVGPLAQDSSAKGGLLDEHWHPRKRALVAIWVVVFLAAAVVAFVMQDDDPYTDEGSGAGALAFAVGMAATVIYLAVGPYLHSRRRKRELDQTKTR